MKTVDALNGDASLHAYAETGMRAKPNADASASVGVKTVKSASADAGAETDAKNN